MKDTQETSMLRKFVKTQTSFAVVIQWSPQEDLASHVGGDAQALHSDLQVSEAISVRQPLLLFPSKYTDTMISEVRSRHRQDGHAQKVNSKS